MPKLEPAHQVIEDLTANVFRRYRNYTLKEFAEDTGVSASTISDLTRGNAWPRADRCEPGGGVEVPVVAEKTCPSLKPKLRNDNPQASAKISLTLRLLTPMRLFSL